MDEKRSIPVPAEIWEHLKRGTVTPADLVKAMRHAVTPTVASAGPKEPPRPAVRLSMEEIEDVLEEQKGKMERKWFFDYAIDIEAAVLKANGLGGGE